MSISSCIVARETMYHKKLLSRLGSSLIEFFGKNFTDTILKVKKIS